MRSMPAFSIITRDTESLEDARPDSQEPSVLSYRREGRSAVEHQLDPGESGGSLENGSSGQIVLRLPDLTSSQPSALRLLIVPQLFWVAIVLGAVLAIVLIWGGKKPVQQAVKEAPAWTSQAPWQQSAPVEADLPAHHELGRPRIGDDGVSDQRPPEIRAARRVDAAWDSSLPPTMPGVATPVGTIIMGASE
ncbi:MAG: hypothetical protein HY288_17745 [Planctomycetia bacterium]|nr:hypothetical protein [Planctomycetia bacterium]